MKRTVTLFLILAVLGAVFIPAAEAYAMPYFEDATITGDNVNVRIRPTTDSPSIATLQKGDRIGVFCEEAEGWYRIIYGNYRGYISKEFVFLPSANSKVGNIKETVNLRQNPGTYSSVVMTLDAGTGVIIKDYSGDWYYIEAELMTDDDEEEDPDAEQSEEDFDEYDEPQNVARGYVHKDYVQLSSGDTPITLLEKGM